MADDTSQAFAAISYTRFSGGGLPSISTYWSGASHQGTVTITGFSPRDSVVTGSFAFEAAAHPDTATHRHLSGQFRVVYQSQQVYCPDPDCPVPAALRGIMRVAPR